MQFPEAFVGNWVVCAQLVQLLIMGDSSFSCEGVAQCRCLGPRRHRTLSTTTCDASSKAGGEVGKSPMTPISRAGAAAGIPVSQLLSSDAV